MKIIKTSIAVTSLLAVGFTFGQDTPPPEGDDSEPETSGFVAASDARVSAEDKKLGEQLTKLLEDYEGSLADINKANLSTEERARAIDETIDFLAGFQEQIGPDGEYTKAISELIANNQKAMAEIEKLLPDPEMSTEIRNEYREILDLTKEQNEITLNNQDYLRQIRLKNEKLIKRLGDQKDLVIRWQRLREVKRANQSIQALFETFVEFDKTASELIKDLGSSKDDPAPVPE